ncbi:hypothetical protein [Sulfuracidifex metallicus]|uniref:hypothetical protein n=1 Tax=Sulfuracidifex metallicus TaxID=47303 RepID=UPI002108BE14|nr:hypothetical protein [Sulfuracidifex metallicus]
MSLFNDSRNITIIQGSYIINHEGNISRETILSEKVITVKPRTIIIPEKLNLSDFVSVPINFSFNQLMAEFEVNSSSSYIVETSLPLPYGGIVVNNGKILGLNGLGQYIFTSNGKLTISINKVL